MELLNTNKKIVRRFYEESWNQRNFGITYETHAADWKHHDNSNPSDFEGPKENEARMKAFVTAFPDIHFELNDLLAENDKVAVRFTATGTHNGKFGPHLPTGKKVVMIGFILHRLENGKIVEDWVVRDTFGLMMQLGVINIKP